MEWVLLERDEKKFGKFKQTGPYTTAQVRDRLVRGKISPYDRVWKTGFSEWRTIAQTSIVTPGQATLGVVQNQSMPSDFIEQEGIAVPVRAGSLEKAWSFFMPSFLVLFSLLFLLAWIIHYHQSSPQRQEGLRAVRALSGLNSHEVHFQIILPTSLNSQGLMQIVSSLEEGVSFEVQISARQGEVLRYPAYFQSLTVNQGREGVVGIDLATFNLPDGKYKVTALYGDNQVEEYLFIGDDGPLFQAEIRRHQEKMRTMAREEFNNLIETKKILHSILLMLAREPGELSGREAEFQQALDGLHSPEMVQAQASLSYLVYLQEWKIISEVQQGIKALLLSADVELRRQMSGTLIKRLQAVN